MPIKLDNEVLHTLTTERVAQNSSDFVNKSGGTIVTGTNYHMGNFIEKSFFGSVGELERRDPTANTEKTGENLNTATQREVKLYYRKQLEWKLTDIKSYGKNNDAVQELVANGIGDAITLFMLNKGVIGAVGAILSNSDAVRGITEETAKFKHLLEAIKPFGDNAMKLKNFIMASNEYFNLMGNGIGVNSDTVIGGILYDATPASLNRGVFVTDTPALQAIETDINGILALSENAVTVLESEERELVSDVVTGRDNLIVRVQLEGAITVGVKGYAYKAEAGINPDNATLASGGNWEMVVDSTKNSAGTIVKCKA